MEKTKYYPHTENEFEYDEILPCPREVVIAILDAEKKINK